MASRSRFKLRKNAQSEAYYIVCDRDFQRYITIQGNGYYFVNNDEKASCFLSRNEANEFISRVKPPSPNNPLIILEKFR